MTSLKNEMLFEHIPSILKHIFASLCLDLWTKLNNLVIRVARFCSPSETFLKLSELCNLKLLSFMEGAHPPVTSLLLFFLSARASLCILVPRKRGPGDCWGCSPSCVYRIHTLESPASLFATYSYFVETSKAIHVTTNNNSHFSLGKHKGHFPSSNVSRSSSESTLLMNLSVV